MKKLLAIVLILALPVIAYFQYSNWKRFDHSADDYAYSISDQIDIHYHDAKMVQEYFDNALEIGRFAQQKYYNDDIDVKNPEEGSIEALNASKYYTQLISRTKYLEALLTKAAELKKKGLSNEDIQILEKTGLQPEAIALNKEKEQHVGLQKGDKNRYVWDLQIKLTEKGFEVPIDGLFGTETETALISFQKNNNIYGSGILDGNSFDALFVK